MLVRDGETDVVVAAPRLRVLLAALLLNTDTVVSVDALADVVWDGSPPTGSATTLRSHVLRLRRVLGPAVGARVLTRSPGYLIQAGRDEVDLLRFARLCEDGEAAIRTGNWALASQLLTGALALWRGDPLADVPSDLLRRDEIPRLAQLRLQALEWRIDAELHLGHHADVVPELRSLTASHPMRERFRAQLMLALYRAGYQAEALAAYQRARQLLAEELGTDPGTELRDLHQRMLTADPMLAVPGARRPAAVVPRQPVPRQLPAGIRLFTGRTDELTALTRLLDQAGDKADHGAVVISAIGGTAGVGKTDPGANTSNRYQPAT